jgi:hypothetical protein
MDGLPRERHIPKQLFGVGTEGFSRGRQLQMGSHSLKHLNAERILERLDARADGRLTRNAPAAR